MSGVAVFNAGELVWAQLVRSDDAKTRGCSAWATMGWAVLRAVAPVLGVKPDQVRDSVDEYAVECMQVYTGPRTSAKPERVDPGDLIELAGVGGYVGGVLGATRSVSYLPREWKGQVPKPIHQVRILKALSEFELDRIRDEEGRRADLGFITFKSAPVDAPLRNTVDAVGIGLFHLGRIKGLGKPK